MSSLITASSLLLYCAPPSQTFKSLGSTVDRIILTLKKKWYIIAMGGRTDSQIRFAVLASFI